MSIRCSSLHRIALLSSVVFLFLTRDALPQQPPDESARVVAAVDPQFTVPLKGNVHPLARLEFDRGAVPDSQPLSRMLLLLQRSPQQDAALQQLLEDQHNKLSRNYHRWLTPEEFGLAFGPVDADIQAVTQWLASQGFTHIKVGIGRTTIEFSGTVGQVRNAFRTEMRHYVINDQPHIANSNDPQIPAALAPVIAGIVSLNDFRPTSHLKRVGSFHKSKSGAITPLFTPAGSANFFRWRLRILEKSITSRLYGTPALLARVSPSQLSGSPTSSCRT